MRALAFDTLKYADELKKVGFTPAQAEGQAKAQAKVIHMLIDDKLADKQDIIRLEQHSTLIKSNLVNRIDEVEIKLEKRINEVEIKLEKRINEVESKLENRINDVESKLEKRINEVEIKLENRLNEFAVNLGNRIDQLEIRLSKLEIIIENLENRLLYRMGILITAGVGVLALIIKL